MIPKKKRGPSYYDRFGAPIDAETWASNRADPGYCELEAYDNGKVRIVVEWLGKVKDPGLMDAEYWPLFRVNIGSYLEDASSPTGKRLVKDLEDGETYGTHEAAVKAYRAFLLKWTQSEMVETKTGFEFVEAEDNILAPPPPEDLDKPESAVQIGNDGAGVW